MNWWQLVQAECKAIFSDRDILLTIFGGLLFYSVLYPLPYLNQVPTEQKVVVVDHDNSSLSRQLIRRADASPKVTIVGQVGSIKAAQAQITANNAHGLLVIPADFRRDLLLGKGATLSYGGDASYFLIYSAIVEGLISAGMDASQQIQVVGLLARGQNPQQVQQSLNSVQLNSVPAYNPSLGYLPYVIPGLFLLILHQTLLIVTGMMGAGQWQQQGYWQHVSPMALISARILIFGLIYAAFSSFYLGYCFYWYDVTVLGNMGEVMLFMLPFLLASAACGVALSSVFTRRDLPTQVLLLTSMPILFVAGFVWPLALIPEPLVWVAQIIPAVPAIMGTLQLNQMGADWSQVLPLWLQLWALLVVFVGLSYAGIKYRLHQQPSIKK